MKKPWRNYLIIPSISLFIIIFVSWLLTPIIAKHYLVKYFSEQGEQATVSGLSVDFFPPKIVLKKLDVHADETQTLAINELSLGIEAFPLFTKKIKVTDAQIDGLILDVKQSADSWVIAGIDLSQYQTEEDPQAKTEEEEEEEEEDQSSPWSVDLPTFRFTDSSIHLARPSADNESVQHDTFTINTLAIDDLEGEALTWQGSVSLDALINSAAIKLSSDFEYAPETANATLKLDKNTLSIKDLAHFIPAPYNQGEGQASINGELDVSMNTTQEVSQFSIKDSDLSIGIENLKLPLADKMALNTDNTTMSVSDVSASYSTDQTANGSASLQFISKNTGFTQDQNTTNFQTLAIKSALVAKQENNQNEIQSKKLELTLEGADSTQDGTKASLESLQLSLSNLLAKLNNESKDLSVNTSLAANISTLSASQDDSSASIGQFELNINDLLSTFNSESQDLSISSTITSKINNASLAQDGSKATVGELQIKLNKLLATLGNKAQDIQVSSDIQADISDLTANLPEQQTASLKTASVSLPLSFDKKASQLTASSDETTFSLANLSLALKDLTLDNSSTNIVLSDFSAKQTDDKNATIAVKSKVTSNDLAVQQGDNSIAYAEFNWSNTLSATQENDKIQVNNSLFDMVIDELKVAQKDTAQASLGNTKLTANTINLALNGDQDPKLAADGVNLLINTLDSKLTADKRAASLDTADLADFAVTQQGDQFTTSLSKLSINNLLVSEPISSDNSLPPLATISKIEVNQVNASQDGASIDSITTTDLKAKVLLDAERRIDNLVFIDTSEQTSPQDASVNNTAPKTSDADKAISNTPDAAEDPAFKAPYYVILNSYELTGDSSVYIEDNGVKPALKRTLDITKLSMKNLNTKDSSQATTVNLSVKNGKYTTLDGDLEIWPMADALTMKSELKVAQAELPPYSPYIANVLGYQIDSGQLNLDLKLHSDKGDISGNANLVLKQFDLGGSYDSGSAIKSGVIPLNLAVSALKDGDDNIDLDIPLSGNIDSPSFGWGDFLFIPVKKALFSASSSYILQTFVPYANVITVARLASDQLLKIRVKPLIYEAQETAVEDEQNVFVKQLVSLLKDKKDSELKVCGVASYSDVGLEAPTSKIDDQTRADANAIAEERAQNLKDYLVSEDIDSARIFVCSPEVDFSKGSQPRIELNF